jgi:hypothetical protein
MPFKPTSLPDQIAAARTQERRAIDGPITSFSGGAAQKAKESSARWTQSNIRNPQTDSAAPWFSGGQPFSELRFQNRPNFDDWKGRFANETDMGWKFAPPPPEPESAPAPSGSGPSSKDQGGEN